MNNLVAILLAAGDSGRLWPIDEKLFINFQGSSLIEHSLNQLIRIGIKNFYLVGNSKNAVLCRKLQDIYPRVNIKVAVQKNNLGMAGAVISVKKEIMNHQILVVGPSDVYEDYLLTEFAGLYRQKPDGIMVGKKLDYYAPLGYLQTDNDIVKGIIENPPRDKIKTNLAAIVFDYFRNSKILVEAIEKSTSKKDDLYEVAKDRLIREGLVVKLLSYNGYWGYLKYPWHVLDISSYFLSRIKSKINKVRIDKTVKIEGQVCLEDDVTILENVKIVGPVYIGRGTLIGQNCLIRESMVGRNCIIGFASEIARSYLSSNSWFHRNYIGDSVILENCVFGSGAVTANYRLDSLNINSAIVGKKIDSGRTKLGAIVGRNCRIGVNTSIMPGIKIGSNSFIGSGIVVDRDLPDNKYLEYKDGHLNIVDNRIKINHHHLEDNRLKLKF